MALNVSSKSLFFFTTESNWILTSLRTRTSRLLKSLSLYSSFSPNSFISSHLCIISALVASRRGRKDFILAKKSFSSWGIWSSTKLKIYSLFLSMLPSIYFLRLASVSEIFLSVFFSTLSTSSAWLLVFA